MREMTMNVCFEVASTCNLNCGYCYRFNKSSKFNEVSLDNISRDVAVKIVKEMKNYFSRIRVTLLGGEPTLVPSLLINILTGLYTIEEHIAGLQILTNGTLLDTSLANSIKRAFPSAELQISIDGPEAEHDACRPSKATKSATHCRTVNSIDVARQSGLEVSLHAVVSKPQIKLGAAAFFDYMQSFGLPWFTGKADCAGVANVVADQEFNKFVLAMLQRWAETGSSELPRWIDGMILIATGALDGAPEQCSNGMMVFAGSKGFAWPCMRLVPMKDYCLGSFEEQGLNNLLEADMRKRLSDLFHVHGTCGASAIEFNGYLKPMPDVQQTRIDLLGSIKSLIISESAQN